MTARPPRKHHYIPEFYQRRWAGDDGCVERYMPVQSRIDRRREPPSAVGFERDLYRFPRKDMDEWTAQQLEWAIFSKIDDAAAKALEAMMSGRGAIRNNFVRISWAVFLRTMLLRTPYQMSATIASLEKIWRNSDGAAAARYSENWQPGMPVTVTAFMEILNPNEGQESAFRLFAQSMSHDIMTRHLVRLPWRIFDCSAADHRLLLSDHPVVLVPLETDDGHVAMPLTPTKLLVIAGNERTKRTADRIPAKLMVRIMNRLTVERAQHCVIAEDRRQEAFILKHFGAAPALPFLAPSKLGI